MDSHKFESCKTRQNYFSKFYYLNTTKDILKPNFKMIGLPEDLKWKHGDTVRIQLYLSSTNDDKTALSMDLGNSTIVS